jgi:hypothetical protein
MKNLKYLLICLTLNNVVIGQVSKNEISFTPCFENKFKSQNNKLQNTKSMSAVWSDDFSDPTKWTIDNSGQSNPNGWTLGSNVNSWYLPGSINSSSGGEFAELTNGALSDVQNSTCPSAVTYTLTTANPINIDSLANSSNVFLSWEEYGARFYDLQQVLISTDNGVTWLEVANNLDYDRLTNSGGSTYSNPTIREVRISSFINSNPNQVLVRFSWTSELPNNSNNSVWITYGWQIDNVSINLLPENDVINQASWIYGENSFGIEYGRTPVSQLEQNYYTGSSIYNFGSMDQNNILINADFSGPTSFSTSESYPLIQSDSTRNVEGLNPMNFSVGVYNGSFTVLSDMDTLGSNSFTDNTLLRNFEITNNIYSIDGIGNHPSGYESLSSLGTNSFTGNPDGIYCANMYHIIQPTTLFSVTALITNSQAGGEVIFHIIDSASFMDNQIIPIYSSDSYLLTTNDVNNGSFTISTVENTGWNSATGSSSWSGLNLDAGNYFFAIEMFSFSLNDIKIVDDLTVDQPWYSSMIYLQSDATSYANGNAFAIRLDLGSSVNLMEMTLNKLEVYPNPSKDFMNINLKNNIISNYEILDVSGKILLSDSFLNETQINTSNLQNGIYIIRVGNDFKSFSNRITITR